jgi:hypothetical protein
MPDNLSFVTFTGVRIRSAGSRLLEEIPQANVGWTALGPLRCVGLRRSELVISFSGKLNGNESCFAPAHPMWNVHVVFAIDGCGEVR